MEILKLNGYSGTKKEEVYTPIHALLVELMPSNVTVPTTGILKAACVGIKVTISYVDKTGSAVYLYRNRDLYEIMEITSNGHGEGVINITTNEGNFASVKGIIDLTFATGAIPFDNDENLVIELTNLNSSHKIGLRGLAAHLRTNHVIGQKTLNVPAATEVIDFNIEDASFIFVSKDADIKELRFVTGKRTTKLTMEELEYIQRRNNDALFLIDGVAKHSYDSFYIIRRKYVEFADILEVTANSSSHSGISINTLTVTKLDSFDGQSLIDDNNDLLWV